MKKVAFDPDLCSGHLFGKPFPLRIEFFEGLQDGVLPVRPRVPHSLVSRVGGALHQGQTGILGLNLLLNGSQLCLKKCLFYLVSPSFFSGDVSSKNQGEKTKTEVQKA